MRQGKFQKPVSKKKHRSKHSMLIVSLVLLIAVAIGGTIAYLRDATNAVTNTFTPAEVKVTIHEDKDATTKSNIKFTNPDMENGKPLDTVPVYIRATLVVYWKDADGNIIAPPKDSAVKVGSVDINDAPAKNNEDPVSDWFKVGSIYYYPDPVAPGETTSVMLDTITVSIPNGSTAKCYIDVRAEAIQATPDTAVEQAWPDVAVNDADGTLFDPAKVSG